MSYQPLWALQRLEVSSHGSSLSHQCHPPIVLLLVCPSPPALLLSPASSREVCEEATYTPGCRTGLFKENQKAHTRPKRAAPAERCFQLSVLAAKAKVEL